MNRALIGVLALLGAACSRQGIRPSSAKAPADSADQVMYRMDTFLNEDGIRKNYVKADTAYIYQAAQRMDLRRLRITFYDNDGRQSSVLTAKSGLYTITTGSLDARGNVIVTSTDGRILKTPHLIYDKAALQLRSDTVFSYDSREERLTGNRFTSDLEFRNVIVDQPKAKQRGAGIVLPGQ